jgi:hypothetical protein
MFIDDGCTIILSTAHMWGLQLTWKGSQLCISTWNQARVTILKTQSIIDLRLRHNDSMWRSWVELRVENSEEMGYQEI